MQQWVKNQIQNKNRMACLYLICAFGPESSDK